MMNIWENDSFWEPPASPWYSIFGRRFERLPAYDKIVHALISQQGTISIGLIWAFLLLMKADSLPVLTIAYKSAIFAFACGLLYEVYCSARYGIKPSWRDMIADLLGAISGGLILLFAGWIL
jgi:hypothetical protein